VSDEMFIEQTFEFWLEEFKPITNHIDPHASFDIDGSGIMFETFGKELEFVKAQDPRCIWTYADGDDGGGYIFNGYHYINRLGYFITEVPCPENTTIQVQVDESPEECSECGVFIYDAEEDDHVCE
jgi:hypothetical protein